MSRNDMGPLQPLLSYDDLARRYGLNEKTIRDWTTRGEGPKPVILRSRVLGFTTESVRAWETEHTNARVDAIYTKREKERLGIR